MASNSKSYIARSALRSFLLGVSQTYEKGIAGVEVQFVDKALTPSGCNWIVTRVDAGTVDPSIAHRIVAGVERANSCWTIVEDGSELDGQVAARRTSLH